ncbi:hypothetical protein [Aquimarina algiphila]|uniref:Uncharacterized protein n=1 Tax=Aquimarina algiphila TaxID=2047982 RepID=A0A554VBA8_9FLAO|nr:hypothetical protein [Aquimarina algiphila]TSE03780.1 hypothetical protein FOF46_28575 [Aquimarina algiphila]
MDNTQLFFIDILKQIPLQETSLLLIQAPYEELKPIFKKISFKNDGVHEYIKLNRENIEILLFETIFNDFEGYLQNIEVRLGENKFFEGYDCMQYGMFSKNFDLSNDFKQKYISLEMLLISEDW